jgi:hypothetical protein
MACGKVSGMEKVWLFETLAVTVATIDFVDPAVAHEPDARERGVRLELRPIETSASGTIYVSPRVNLQPAVCRIDLLESRPGAADRVHWHPAMAAGEPGKRVFDPELSADPVGWLHERLRHVDRIITQTTLAECPPPREELSAIADAADDIVAATKAGLEWARRPWPDVTRDRRGIGRELETASTSPDTP